MPSAVNIRLLQQSVAGSLPLRQLVAFWAVKLGCLLGAFDRNHLLGETGYFCLAKS